MTKKQCCVCYTDNSENIVCNVCVEGITCINCYNKFVIKRCPVCLNTDPTIYINNDVENQRELSHDCYRETRLIGLSMCLTGWMSFTIGELFLYIFYKKSDDIFSRIMIAIVVGLGFIILLTVCLIILYKLSKALKFVYNNLSYLFINCECFTNNRIRNIMQTIRNSIIFTIILLFISFIIGVVIKYINNICILNCNGQSLTMNILSCITIGLPIVGIICFGFIFCTMCCVPIIAKFGIQEPVP